MMPCLVLATPPCVFGGTVAASQTHEQPDTWGHRLQQIHIQELSKFQKYPKVPRIASIVSDVRDQCLDGLEAEMMMRIGQCI